MSVFDMNPCSGCGGPVATYWKFCIGCGVANPDFDPVESAIQLGKSVEDFCANECNLGHPGALRYIRDMRDDPETLFENPFCSMCGARILPEKN